MQLLTRLNPSVQSWNPYPAQDYNGLTTADINAACAGCDPIGLMVLKRRVCDLREPDRGFYRLYQRIIDLANRHKWKTRKIDRGRERIRALLDVCLTDYAAPLPCRICKGTGENELKKDCNACGGTGNRNRSHSERARQMGLNKSTYIRIWKPRYRIIMDYLLDVLPECEYQAKKNIYKKLR